MDRLANGSIVQTIQSSDNNSVGDLLGPSEMLGESETMRSTCNSILSEANE